MILDFGSLGVCRPVPSCFNSVAFLFTVIVALVDPAFVIRAMLGAGIRFGEAKNPGPDTLFRFGITNPTCVSNKFDAYRDLLFGIDCHVVSLSETAATESVQLQLSSKFKPKKCKILWSPPVLPLLVTASGAAHTRGKASGVALISRLTCRPSRLELPKDWIFTTRFVHGIVQLGQSHIQVVVLYCKPVHGHVGVDFNSALMRCALDQVRQIPLPFVIMGDFNMKVSQFDTWDEFLAMGCRSLTDIHQEKFGCPMPFTCNGVTCPDNAIMSPMLASLVTKITVLDPTWFATHCPVVFELTLPGHTLFQHKLRLPKSFVDLSVEDDALQQVSDSQTFQQVTNLQEWANTVEDLVDKALKQGHGSKPALPKAYRGRCRPMVE